MRIRQIKPAFWADARIAELPEAVRLFYVGLWMQADDAGWFRWDATQIARDLYGYESRTRREKRVGQMFASLVEAGRVILHDCGHAAIPTMPGHQRLASPEKQVRSTFAEHQRCPADPRVSPPVPADPRYGTERIGKERNGSAPAGANDGPKAKDEERRTKAEALHARFVKGELTADEYATARRELLEVVA